MWGGGGGGGGVWVWDGDVGGGVCGVGWVVWVWGVQLSKGYTSKYKFHELEKGDIGIV